MRIISVGSTCDWRCLLIEKHAEIENNCYNFDYFGKGGIVSSSWINWIVL